MRILIAEDEPIGRKMLKNVLSQYGACETAVDGEKAVDAFREALENGKPFDLICLDIMMPRKDGHQVLKEVRTMERRKDISTEDGVKVIMVTALNDPKTVVKAYYKGGASAYLPKPLDLDVLIQTMNELGFNC